MLRGIALPGIALMNIEWFTRPPAELGDGLPPDAAGLEFATGWLVLVFVQGKFWLLFSLLFGAGFTLMRQRLLATGRPFLAPYLRRVGVLFLLGIAHGLLLWSGDILHAYALAALGLLALSPLTEADPRTAATVRGLVGAVIFLCFTAWVTLLAVLVVAGEAVGATPVDPAALGPSGAGAGESAAAIYAHGDWLAVTAQRGRDFLEVASADPFVVPVALSVFLIGSWLLDSGRLSRPQDFLRFHRVAAFALLPAGLLLTVAGGWYATGVVDASSTATAMFQQWSHWVAALPMTLGYIGLVVLAMRRPAVAAFALRWIAPSGRMALTNYLMASAVLGTLFFGYGFGLWGQVPRPGQVALVALLTIGQCLFSAAWLARFRLGPMEWLWRAATWLHWPPLRREPALP